MTSLIFSIRPENFIKEVILENRLVLLICMPPDDIYSGQLAVVRDVAKKYYNELKVGLLAEDSMETFRKKFNIIGTPTFLFMLKGKEVNRLWGVTELKTITNLIEQYLQLYR